jgi:hypothetical protein
VAIKKGVGEEDGEAYLGYLEWSSLALSMNFARLMLESYMTEF